MQAQNDSLNVLWQSMVEYGNSMYYVCMLFRY